MICLTVASLHLTGCTSDRAFESNPYAERAGIEAVPYLPEQEGRTKIVPAHPKVDFLRQSVHICLHHAERGKEVSVVTV